MTKKKEETLEVLELVAEMVNRGGAIVSSSVCSPKQISAARKTRRFAADADGLGFVLLLPRKERSIVRWSGSGRFASKRAAKYFEFETHTEKV